MTTTAYSEEIKKIEITGNNRISNETIAVFGDIELNKDYSEKEVNDLINLCEQGPLSSNVDHVTVIEYKKDYLKKSFDIIKSD